MSSLLNVFNASNKSKEFNLTDIEVLVHSEVENWFKLAHVGKILGLPQVEKLLVGLHECEIRGYIC